MVLQNNGIRVHTNLEERQSLASFLFLNHCFEDTYHTLGIAVLAAHGQVQSESIWVDYVNVTSFRTAQRVDTPVEWLVSAYLDSDTGVLAVYGNYMNNWRLMIVPSNDLEEIGINRILFGSS